MTTPMHPIAAQDSNRREAQGGYLDGGFLSCSLTSPNPRGEYVAQASARPKGRFYTLKHRSCCSSGGSDTAIPFLHTTHNLGGKVGFLLWAEWRPRTSPPSGGGRDFTPFQPHNQRASAHAAWEAAPSGPEAPGA